MMERRKVDILCVQETRWKGSKARSIGAGFKLFYFGVDSKRNGVGVVLKEEFVRNVLEVKRVSDRVMSLKLEIEGVMLNVASGYAPQVGCELEEKERFWSELDEVMESIPTGERVVIGADFNGHVGEGNTGDEEVMGKFGVKERNLEGQMVVDFAKRMDMGVVNTYFQKREEHRVTYKSGGRRTQVDYMLCRRGNLKEISDCKVVVGESVARQHRMVVCRMTLMVCKTKRSKIEIEKKTKWWKLKKEECCEEFRQKLRQALGGQVVLPDDWETTAEVIRETGRKVLGVSSGRRKEDKETWWWKYRDGQRELHCVFVDLEKAYDRVPREELWYCMRKSGVAEKYVRVVQDIYERSRTVVRCAVGQTEEFNVEVGLHQGSALSPFLFAMVKDQLSEEVRQESPWTMMFADDIVICSESREQVEENLERWRFVLERRGMKVSRSKTEYMCVNEREGSGTVRLQGEEVKKVQEFKYLGSTVQSNGECGKEVKKRVQAGWNGWRKVSGVLCDRKISARIKGKVYRTVVRPAMLYGLETVSLRKRQESELEVAELKMLRFSLGVTRLDRIRNEYIRGTAHVGRLGDKVREDRLRWFGHVQRRESEYIGRRMLDMGLPGRRQRGRPKRRYMDGINEDMKLVGASVEDAEDRDRIVSQILDDNMRKRRRRRCSTRSEIEHTEEENTQRRRTHRGGEHTEEENTERRRTHRGGEHTEEENTQRRRTHRGGEHTEEENTERRRTHRGGEHREEENTQRRRTHRGGEHREEENTQRRRTHRGGEHREEENTQRRRTQRGGEHTEEENTQRRRTQRGGEHTEEENTQRRRTQRGGEHKRRRTHRGGEHKRRRTHRGGEHTEEENTQRRRTQRGGEHTEEENTERRRTHQGGEHTEEENTQRKENTPRRRTHRGGEHREEENTQRRRTHRGGEHTEENTLRRRTHRGGEHTEEENTERRRTHRGGEHREEENTPRRRTQRGGEHNEEENTQRRRTHRGGEHTEEENTERRRTHRGGEHREEENTPRRRTHRGGEHKRRRTHRGGEHTEEENTERRRTHRGGEHTEEENTLRRRTQRGGEHTEEENTPRRRTHEEENTLRRRTHRGGEHTEEENTERRRTHRGGEHREEENTPRRRTQRGGEHNEEENTPRRRTHRGGEHTEEENTPRRRTHRGGEHTEEENTQRRRTHRGGEHTEEENTPRRRTHRGGEHREEENTTRRRTHRGGEHNEEENTPRRRTHRGGEHTEEENTPRRRTHRGGKHTEEENTERRRTQRGGEHNEEENTPRRRTHRGKFDSNRLPIFSVSSKALTLETPFTIHSSYCTSGYYGVFYTDNEFKQVPLIQKREEHRVTYKSGGRRTQVDYILCRRGNLKEISDCKVVVGESVARQHRMVVCRMTLMVCKTKRSKIEIEKKTKWWKLKKEECCEEFRQKLRQALGGQVVLPDDWETTAEVIRETGRKVLGVSSGRRKEDKETWWWNEEVQDSVQGKRLAKKKWDMDRTEENRQEYKELQRRVKREVSKAKQMAYDELYTRLDTREGEKDLYRLARQRDRDGKDVQQVRVIKDRDGSVLTSEESVQRRWKEYFEELMNEENEREKRVEGVNSVEQKVDKIRKDEVRKALKRMKSGKEVGPDDIPVEVWKCLGEAAVEFLASLFNRVLESERMPEEWRRSVLVPIFKNKGDVQSCSNYRGIKLMSQTMKVWERVVEARLRKVVEICEQQYGFMPRKSTTDAIFALRILMEKYRDGQREWHCVFVDLEEAYDRVPREELWYCMRKSGVAEKYVRVVQDIYERSRTVVRCAVGQTEEFNVEVGLHQGSALSPFLFAMVMDQLSEEVRQESPWTMMFADDIVICSESREQVEENLERWRCALERRGMKVSRSKTEYMCVNEREGSGTVRLQGEEVKKVQEFKYLGSTVQSNGECGKEVKKRLQAGWNVWRKVLGVLCDRKISARIKGKVYRTVVRPAMLYGLETVSLRKRQESELEVAELKMLRFSLGVTRLDRIRNEYIRGTAHVGRLGDKVREARLRWFGHVQRRE
ncbi:hypothetical protein QTP70_015565, partial [Hemibagrus guttatus]